MHKCMFTHKQVEALPGAPPAHAHLVQGSDEANTLMLLPAPCQTLAQEVPIVLALPKEVPLLLEVKLAETQAWACLFGGVPCPPSLSPVGLGSNQLPQQSDSRCLLAVPSLLAPCLSFPFAVCVLLHTDVSEPCPGRATPAGASLHPKTPTTGSALLSAVPQGKVREGAMGMEDWRTWRRNSSWAQRLCSSLLPSVTGRFCSR